LNSLTTAIQSRMANMSAMRRRVVGILELRIFGVISDT
jgi:hypothetical protein